MYKYLTDPMVLHYHNTSQPFSSFDIYIMHDYRMFWLESSIPKVALKQALGHDKDYFEMCDDKFTFHDLKRQLVNLLLKSRPVQKYSYPRLLEKRLDHYDIWQFHRELKGAENLLFTKNTNHAQLILLRNEFIAQGIFEKWPKLEATKGFFAQKIQKNEDMLNAFLDMESEIVKLDRMFIPEIGEIWLVYNEYEQVQMGVVLKNNFKKV
jgi:hypothetical protein